MADLTGEHCEPCEGGVPPMERSEAEEYLEDLGDWGLKDVPKIQRTYSLEDFQQTMEFVNRIGDIADREGHHPHFTVRYSEVDVTIWTHAVDGLTKNDFILAAKLDEAYKDVRSAVV